MRENKDRLFLLPVRRVLMGVTLAYLAGVYVSTRFVFPLLISLTLGVLLLMLAVFRHSRRKCALFCALILFFLLGNQLCGRELGIVDWPTGTNTWIEGTVSAIEKEYRVYLSDVRIEGGRTLHRDAVVTLMPPKKEGAPMPAMPEIGQRVCGLGRLFAPETPRNPGGSDRRIAALTKGYDLSGYLKDGWKAQGETAFSLREEFRRAREALLAHIEKLFGEHAALFQGIMLGDKRGMEKEFTRAMQMTGTAHILTVSGMHVGMIALMISFLLDRTPLGGRGRFALLGAFLMVFSGLTGGAAGTVRAAIMAMMRELAALRGRRYDPLTGLSCAALLMTLYRPVWALNASFQFSFFVVLGIILLAGGLERIRNRRRQTDSKLVRFSRWFVSALCVSLSAQSAAVPMQLLLYGYVPVLSLPMNAFCGFLLPYMMAGGWLCAVVGAVSKTLGGMLASLVSLLAAGFEAGSLHVGALDWAIIRLPAPYPATVFLFALLMMILSSRIRFGGRRRVVSGMLAALIVLTYLPRFDLRAQYVQLDVGQGDAALFRRGREAVVIDVGPTDSYDLLRYLRHEGLQVKAVVLSHFDDDHAGALKTLLDSEVHVPAVVTARDAQNDELSEDVLAALAMIKEKGLLLREVQRGDLIEADKFQFLALSPDASLSGSNERSLVLKTDLEDVSFLLTGDLPSACEPADLPPCDVLKVAHHGSKSSTSENLLAAVRPSIAIISVGEDNWYRHPSKAVLDRLNAAGAATLRTDESGCITLILKNGEIRVRRYLPDSGVQ